MKKALVGTCRVNQAFAMVLFILLVTPIAFAQNSHDSGPDVIARVGDASVLILSGDGAGRLNSTSTGIIMRPDGIILTAFHTIKNAKEVQIRLKAGDIYDRVILLGVDERRDVAALKITATNLPVLAQRSSSDFRQGETVYVVSNSGGLAWSASKGIISSYRMADEIPGAGQGYKVLQFTAPVSGGASGGPLVDERGALLGVITKATPSGIGFAVPIDSVIGLGDGTMNMALGSGSALQLPTNHPTPSSAAVADSDPQKILRSAKTLLVRSHTQYFTVEALEREFAKQKSFAELGLITVRDNRVADMVITVDRPLFTYEFTYSVTDARTSIVLNVGKVTAIDGGSAAGKIAKQLIDEWGKIRLSTPPKAN
jgi:hypothetical protein